MYALLALACAKPFIIRRNERYYALIDHDAMVVTCVLTIDLLDANQFSRSYWCPYRHVYQH
jgi:hypothetical protein